MGPRQIIGWSCSTRKPIDIDLHAVAFERLHGLAVAAFGLAATPIIIGWLGP
ncbi:MAG: hypothetical protein QM820_43475 [Minicystis sp.]